MNLNFERNKETIIPKDNDSQKQGKHGGYEEQFKGYFNALMSGGKKAAHEKMVLRLWQVKIIGPLNVESEIKVVYTYIHKVFLLNSSL